MNIIKKFVSIVMVCTLLLQSTVSVTAVSNTLQDNPQISQEITCAISYGFVPKEIQKNLKTGITFAQYCTMLSKMIELYDKSLVADFKLKAKLALTSSKTMKREDGMLAAYYAALSMKLGSGEKDFTNGNWMEVHKLCGEGAWNDFSWDYHLFPNWNKPWLFSGNYMSSGYFFGMAQFSRVSGKALFDFDEKNNTMHVNDLLTREAAICSVARLYESAFEVKERSQTQWDKDFLALYNKRLDAIQNSETTIVKSDSFIAGKTYTGTAYYISINGSDDNDGLSPDTSWATISRTYGTVKKGDAVFFERGGVWRQELQCMDGVTYSAYGRGAKPRFYGSQENGADAGKWRLWYEGKDGKKIWKYHTDVSDCGGIVLNDGEHYASRVFSYWDGTEYVFVKNHGIPFDITKGLEYDLQFYSTFEAAKRKMPIYVYDIDSRGPLYLRCDAGNPGEIYASIEFQTAPKPEAGYCGIVKAGEGCVIDNLCVMYGVSRGIASHESSNLVIQNCEVAWIGGGTHEVNGSGYIPASGEGIGIEGSNNIARNCYVHDCFDGGIISELRPDFPYYVENQTIEGNIIERCISGVLIASHKVDDLVTPTFGNVNICDNYVLYSGYGWSCDPHYDFTWGDKAYNGNAITFWDNPNINKGIFIKNNTLYLAKSALIHLSMGKKYLPALEGNVYVQNRYGFLAYWAINYGVFEKGTDTTQFMSNIMGDKSGKIVDAN